MTLPIDPILYAIPGFVVLLVSEVVWARRAVAKARPVRGYLGKDAVASIVMGLGSVVVSAGTKITEFAIYTFLWTHRLIDIPVRWWTWLLLLVADDLCYYMYHAASHKVRLFWASHENHHSSEYYNLSTALRQSWTKQVVTPWFWMPLALLGFPPWTIVTQQAISLIYQYWIHTEAIGTLGPLEWVLNTPSHHRVHHATNPQYIDRNHAGVFIVWDRLFGTFEPERERPVYGLTKNIHTFNPLRIATHEYVAIARDVRQARSLREVIGYVLGPPGWMPADRRLVSQASPSVPAQELCHVAQPDMDSGPRLIQEASAHRVGGLDALDSREDRQAS